MLVTNQVDVWVLSLYLPANQKTFKVYFQFRQLKKIHKLLAHEADRLMVSGIENLDVTGIDRSLLRRRTPEGRPQDAFTQQKLKAFDQLTGAHDVSEDFLMDKTQVFLQNNGSFHNNSLSGVKARRHNLRYVDPDMHAGADTQTARFAHKKEIDRMFSNPYLACYFKIHGRKKRQLDVTRKLEADSVQSKEEHEDVDNLDHNHVFNQTQKLPFWKKLLSSLCFSDSSVLEDDEGDKEFRLSLRIRKGHQCYNKKLHHMVFEGEVESFEGGLTLVHHMVSLEPLCSAFESPYVDGTTLSLVKAASGSIIASEFKLCLKAFDIQKGRMRKEKVNLVHFLRRHLPHYKDKPVSFADIQQAVEAFVFDGNYAKGQAALSEFIESENFEYQPAESRVVTNMLQEEARRLKEITKGTVQSSLIEAREDFIRWRRLKGTSNSKPAFERVVSTIATIGGKTRSVKLRMQVFFNQKSVLLRLYDPLQFFKHDALLPFDEVAHQFQIHRAVLASLWRTKHASFISKISERIIDKALPDIMRGYHAKYYNVGYQEQIVSRFDDH